VSKKEQLDQVAQRVASCQKCSLYKTATNPVPGNGDPDSELLFIGEGPGFWEDQKGIPFCGAAGKLLDELLTSINLDREKVFVANILKHRPPENREPMPDEIEACKEYLDDQIKIIAPKAIVTLGRFSMMKFFPYGKISIDHGKGRLIEYNGVRYILLPMYHPAAALRGATVESQLREDFKKIPEEIERLDKILNGVAEVSEPVVEPKKEEQLELI